MYRMTRYFSIWKIPNFDIWINWHKLLYITDLIFFILFLLCIFLRFSFALFILNCIIVKLYYINYLILLIWPMHILVFNFISKQEFGDCFYKAKGLRRRLRCNNTYTLSWALKYKEIICIHIYHVKCNDPRDIPSLWLIYSYLTHYIITLHYTNNAKSDLKLSKQLPVGR